MNFLILLDMLPTQKLSFPVPLLITDHVMKKEVSLIAFRQILPQTFPMACIFRHTFRTYLEKLDGTKSLKRKQCPARLLSPRIIPQVSPFLPKMSPTLMLLCCTQQVWACELIKYNEFQISGNKSYEPPYLML